MKKLTTLLMTLMLMCTALWAEETVTVSANSSDISEGLDLKVVAKLFAEAKNLEEFETMLNNPDSAFCNLDLNGDGQVDYLRVVETGEGNKRLIVLQAILAKDIYQDVASIYVEKDEKNEVSVQVIGDEYVYGENYVIEPVYVYRPVIYDWFWCDAWYAWHSPWYWGYYPGWWYAHNCWAHDWYWHHCYTFHHYHHCCSFRNVRQPSHHYHDMRSGVTRREFAAAHPERAFSQRNSGMTNAREIRRTTGVHARTASGRDMQTNAVGQRHAATAERTFGSANTASARTQRATRSTSGTETTRSTATARTTRRADASSQSTASTRSTSSTSTRSTGSTTRSTSSSTTRSTGATRSTSTTIRQPQRTSSSTSTASRVPSSGSSSRSGGYSGSSTRSSGSTYNGSSSRSGGYSGGGYSGGSRSSGGGHSSSGGSRGGGGSGVTRR